MCKGCKYAPTSYKEYCMKSACPDAYTEKAKKCNLSSKEKGDNKQ